MFSARLTPAVSQVSKIRAGGVITTQGERVSRYYFVLSGSIGTLNHAAVEHWHSKALGSLADMRDLPRNLQDLVKKSEHLEEALKDLDKQPLNFSKYIHDGEVMQILAARLALQSHMEDDPPPPTLGARVCWTLREHEVALHDNMRWNRGIMSLGAGCAIGLLCMTIV